MSNMDLRQLPAIVKRQIPTARLPINYEAASVAIRNCVRVDECKEWSDRTTAIASYARQAKDTSMFDAATSIKNRAWRRMGELLEAQFPNMRPSDRAKQTGIPPSLARGSVVLKSVPEGIFEARLKETPVPGPRKITNDYAKQQRKSTVLEEERAYRKVDWNPEQSTRDIAISWLRFSAVPSLLKPADVASIINSDEDYLDDWNDVLDFVRSVNALIAKSANGVGK